MEGLDERLKKELEARAPPDTNINLLANSNRDIAAWKGASAYAASPAIAERMVSRDEYYENGP